MNPKVFGWEHWTYLAVIFIAGFIGLFCTKKFAKTEKAQTIALKSMAGVLLCCIIFNRISLVFRYEEVRWIALIPDSFCGMSSLVLSLAVLIGKKDNKVLHFVWHLALVGGVATSICPTFIGQSSSIFYLPTISGLLHHSVSIIVVVALLMFKQVHITYKKWHYSVIGFAGYITLGAFLITACGNEDAFAMVNPLISGTPLTVWVTLPIYFVVYILLLFTIEKIRKYRLKNQKQ